MQLIHFDVFACQRYVLLNSKRTKSIFGRDPPVPRWGSLQRSLRPPSRMERAMPPPHTLPTQRPSASRSRRLEKCPEFLS